MNPTLDLSRTFLPFGFRAEFEASAPSSSEALRALARVILEQCISRALLREGQIRDIKGRDPNLSLIEDIPQKLKPNGHELLFLHGTAPADVLDNPDSDDNDSEEEEWSFAVHTPFKEFEGSHHIQHRVVPQMDLFDRDQLVQILEGDRAKVSLLRFGFDIFRSQRFLAMIGFIPSAVRTVLIDADERELRFKLFAEELRQRDQSPFAVVNECQLWAPLSTALLQIYRFNPEEIYIHSLVGSPT